MSYFFFSRSPSTESGADGHKHVCMPMLSIVGALLLRRLSKGKSLFVYYDILPRYLRGLCRVLGIPENVIVSALSSAANLTIRKIPHGDAVPNYPFIHLHAMETVADITRNIVSDMQERSSHIWLEHLVGRKPAVAYTAKYLSQHQIFPEILPLLVCRSRIANSEKLTFVPRLGWQDDWRRAVASTLTREAIDYLRWPTWWRVIHGSLVRAWLLLAIPAIACRYVLCRGATWRAASMKTYKVITEFIDPNRLNRTAHDADCWVDGVSVDDQDILFFLTERQQRHLARHGCAMKDVLAAFQKTRYELSVLERLPYSLVALVAQLKMYAKCLRRIAREETASLSGMYLQAWSEYLDILPLFLHYTSTSLLYPTFANGRTSVRFDDAIITGLCRQNNMTSVGIQTRSIYAAKFEDCFDCFDVYVSWGPAWDQTSEAKQMFIERTVTVGCIYLDQLLPLFAQHQDLQSRDAQAGPVKVVIFPSDISPRHHYTKNYSRSFLLNCFRLAIKHPECTFFVKFKNPQHAEEMMGDEEFFRGFCDVKENVHLLGLARGDYAQLLASSDIVIAIGFTTPGIEALLLGKRSIYYEELGCGGQALRHLPDFVVDSAEELCRVFEKALGDYLGYADVNSAGIALLDPYRDGKAGARIRGLLTGAV